MILKIDGNTAMMHYKGFCIPVQIEEIILDPDLNTYHVLIYSNDGFTTLKIPTDIVMIPITPFGIYENYDMRLLITYVKRYIDQREDVLKDIAVRIGMEEYLE